MTSTTRRKLNVPYETDRPDRIPAQRYFDPEFFAMENELLWTRTWQMAARLEYLQKPGDFVEYEILDRSVVIVRVDATTIKAYENTCRHRGVKLASGAGNLPSGFTCPFHGWCWSLDGTNTFLYQPDLFDEGQRDAEDVRLIEVRCETAVGCAFINFDKSAPSLLESIERFSGIGDAWRFEDLRSEWWMSCLLPTNWKLAMEAFMEGYHVAQTHPQLVSAAQRARMGKDAIYKDLNKSRNYAARVTTPVTSSQAFIDAMINSMRLSSVGMAGMIHENDIRIAEGLRNLDLSADPENAVGVFRRHLNEAVTSWHTARGENMPDLHALTDNNMAPVEFCFPNYFMLPNLSSAASYRIRPLTPETCLFELWSLTRYPQGQEPAPPAKPIPLPPDHSSWPPIPTQDFSNLPIQQVALHNPGFKFMRLAEKTEGQISNYQRVVDGFLAGLGYDELTPAIQVASGTFDAPIQDVGF